MDDKNIDPDTTERFLQNPEAFPLFRAENATNADGLHFALDKEWVRNFGSDIRTGTLPVGSKIKLLTEADLKQAFEQGLFSEQELWDSIFDQEYDAILGHDAMNSRMLDVIVNPKHLERFKLMEQ